MKKILIAILIIFSVSLGYSLGFFNNFLKKDQRIASKSTILTVGLVADSHTENDLLAKALFQLKAANVDFVIGLGDYTNVGTVLELTAAKKAFDHSGFKYYLIPGDHDGWESREKNEGNITNFEKVFGTATTQTFDVQGVQFNLVDNSDIYKGISPGDWSLVTGSLSKPARLRLVFAHKTPFHPDSAHIMGEDSPEVARQAKDFLALMEGPKGPNEPKGPKVDGFFSGDLHFFARFNSPSGSVRITTIGAVTSQRNFQGPRFGILKIYSDYTWDVLDQEIH
ncbi:MAG TPA: metallophosphoesterase [Candidatus Saccharimonadales bacterium]|nr:metallophosphoesterase [Candidatus Saccharimonadales bacterium]